jgi:hypothetical protein
MSYVASANSTKASISQQVFTDDLIYVEEFKSLRASEEYPTSVHLSYERAELKNDVLRRGISEAFTVGQEYSSNT